MRSQRAQSAHGLPLKGGTIMRGTVIKNCDMRRRM
jgi:hypothetical protein